MSIAIAHADEKLSPSKFTTACSFGSSLSLLSSCIKQSF